MITREEINEKCTKYGISQNQLAREAGFDIATMSRWVNQRRQISRLAELSLRTYFAKKDSEVSNKNTNE
jgi:transcriptional regulator with XRE-family HTH domain